MQAWWEGSGVLVLGTRWAVDSGQRVAHVVTRLALGEGGFQGRPGETAAEILGSAAHVRTQATGTGGGQAVAGGSRISVFDVPDRLFLAQLYE